MMDTYNPDELRRAYRAVQSGDARMRAIRMAVSEAERAGDDKSAVRFHQDLIRESVFSGDRYQALVDFPQYLALVRKNPEVDAALIWDTTWTFKWILEAATEFYQIEKKQILRWHSEFRKELVMNGWSLKPFYQQRINFYKYSDRAKLRLDYEAFRDAHRDRMSDGEADEYDAIVECELLLGNREKALEAANHIFEKRLHSDEIPAKTYSYLLSDAIRRGDAVESDKWAKKLLPYCIGERFRLEQLGVLMYYYAKVDLECGMKLYTQNLHLRDGSRNPLLCFWFDRGAACVLRASGSEEQAAQLFADCKVLAEKFDARNGSDFFASALRDAKAQ